VAAAVAVAVSSGAPARAAGGSDACLAAPVEGQKLQRAGKLLDARDRFASCSLNTCPAEVVEDCMRWARQVDDALPSVVVAARDTKGKDLLDVRVSIDGKPPAEMSTRAVRLDPGSHTFVFQREGSADVKQQVMLREGEKREVLATFGAPPDTSSPTTPATSTATVSERPVPVAAWLAGGVSGLALISFATFGTLGVMDRGTDHCDTGCPSDQKSGIDAKFLVADVSLGVGVVALAVAAWLYLSRPSVEVQAASAAAGPPGFAGIRF
jgi:hypothetical protein